MIVTMSPIDIQPVGERDIVVWIIIAVFVMTGVVSMGKFLIKLYPLVNKLATMLEEWPFVNKKISDIDKRLQRLEKKREDEQKQ